MVIFYVYWILPFPISFAAFYNKKKRHTYNNCMYNNFWLKFANSEHSAMQALVKGQDEQLQKNYGLQVSIHIIRFVGLQSIFQSLLSLTKLHLLFEKISSLCQSHNKLNLTKLFIKHTGDSLKVWFGHTVLLIGTKFRQRARAGLL